MNMREAMRSLNTVKEREIDKEVNDILEEGCRQCIERHGLKCVGCHKGLSGRRAVQRILRSEK